MHCLKHKIFVWGVLAAVFAATGISSYAAVGNDADSGGDIAEEKARDLWVSLTRERRFAELAEKIPLYLASLPYGAADGDGKTIDEEVLFARANLAQAYLFMEDFSRCEEELSRIGKVLPHVSDYHIGLIFHNVSAILCLKRELNYGKALYHLNEAVDCAGEAGYITFLRLADEVGNLSDDELHELDVQYWIDSYYGMYEIEEIMPLVTLYGNKFNERMFSLVPDTEYCIYAYGVDAQGERLTPVTKAWFTTETLEMSDTSFEISITKGAENEKGQIPVHITYTPDDNETNYLTGFTVWSEGMDMDALIEQQQTILNDFIVKNMTFGAIPLEDVIAYYYPAGEQSDDFTPMKDYEFVVYCMCVAHCGLINSEVIYKTFDTFIE